jgi:hypothetical protein
MAASEDDLRERVQKLMGEFLAVAVESSVSQFSKFREEVRKVQEAGLTKILDDLEPKADACVRLSELMQKKKNISNHVQDVVDTLLTCNGWGQAFADNMERLSPAIKTKTQEWKDSQNALGSTALPSAQRRSGTELPSVKRLSGASRSDLPVGTFLPPNNADLARTQTPIVGESGQSELPEGTFLPPNTTALPSVSQQPGAGQSELPEGTVPPLNTAELPSVLQQPREGQSKTEEGPRPRTGSLKASQTGMQVLPSERRKQPRQRNMGKKEFAWRIILYSAVMLALHQTVFHLFANVK